MSVIGFWFELFSCLGYSVNLVIIILYKLVIFI